MRTKRCLLAIVATILIACSPKDRSASINAAPDGEKTSSENTASQIVANGSIGMIASPFRIASNRNGKQVNLKDAPRKLSTRNVVAFQGDLVIVGGSYRLSDMQRDRNDILASTDGRQWWSVSENAISPERYGYSVGVKKDAVFIVGGVDSRVDYQQTEVDRKDIVIFRQDELSTKVINGIRNATYAQGIEYNEGLFLIGEFTEPKSVSAITKIENGKIVSTSEISGGEMYSLPQVWEWKSRLYITDRAGLFWESADGLRWKPIAIESSYEPPQVYLPRTMYTIIPHEDSWYLVGGYVADEMRNGYFNDVWKSTDAGRNWTRISEYPSSVPERTDYFLTFPARRDCVGLVFKGDLLVGGGEDAHGNRYDFWASHDGIKWKEVK